jgi:hypothetical protein
MRYELTDYEWAAIRPMLPNKPCGVPRVNDRRVLNGIFWVLRSGATTCYNHFVRWRQAFFLAFWRGGAVELPGRSRPAPGVVELRRGGSMSISLSRFSGWRSRSLSLGEGLTDSTGARDGTRADGVLDRGRRRIFSF